MKHIEISDEQYEHLRQILDEEHKRQFYAIKDPDSSESYPARCQLVVLNTLMSDIHFSMVKNEA